MNEANRLKQPETPITRRDAMKKIAVFASAAVFSKLLTGCAMDVMGPGNGYTRKLDEKTLQKGVIVPLGPLSVRLLGVAVDNPYKETKLATVEFLKSDGTAYLTWGFELNDQKIVQPPGGGTDGYALVCSALPEFGSTDEWMTLQAWRKSVTP